MKQRHLCALGLAVAVGLLLFSVPSYASTRSHGSPRTPSVGITWTTRTTMPFEAARWDGALYKPSNRIYFLGFRRADDSTDGSVWYYDVAGATFTDTGVDMPVPVSNYEISPLTDAAGDLGFYIFGGRDGNGVIVTTVQAYFPATNTTAVISSDPWPGTTPSDCVSLPGTGVVTAANHGIVLGGLSFSANGCVDDESAQTWIYFPKKAPGTRWRQGPDLNIARGYIAGAVVGMNVYAIGGDTNPNGALFAQPTVESWVMPNGTWNDKGVADLPVADGCDESQAFAFRAGPLANDIVLAGCGQWPEDLPNSLLYRPATNSWSNVGAFNQSRRNHAGELVGTTMFVAGGVTSNGGQFLDGSESGVGMNGANRPGFLGPDRVTGATATTS
jgi:hypothetical protein